MPSDQRFNVERWLTDVGLPQYGKAFLENDIDRGVLEALTADDLREMGVTSVGHRRRILEAVAKLGAAREADPTSPAAAHAPAMSPATEPLAAAERRQLTVMFCDLMDSTALSVRVDPEDYREFIAAYRRVLEEAIQPFQGHVAQYLGDGVLVYFGYPQSFEHDAENAVGAGLAIVEKITALPPFAGHPPQVRIGIATGLTVIGAADRMREALNENAVGETPNLAARLQALAAPNTVVVAASTRERIGDLFECSDLGAFDLKGFDRPVHAWEVLRQSASATRFDALRKGARNADFFDREAEFGRLRNRLAAARAGRGQIVVISGEAGLGKSRLAREALIDLGPRGEERPILQCTPYNISTPLHPVRYYIERRSGISSQDTPDSALQKLSALLARAGPVTPERLALLAELARVRGADKTALQGLSSHELRNRTMRTLAGLFEVLARDASVMVVEDLQWIDPSTAELIESLLPVLRQQPVLVIGTMRPGPFPNWLERPEARLIQLDPLPDEDVRRLIQSVAGAANLPPSVIDVIATRSDGVPIFAEELTRGYLESASRGQNVQGEGTNIPSTLVESLLARLDGLKEGRKIASLAAVIGREFPIAILVAVSGLPEAEVRAAIGELLDAEVLIPGHSQFGEAIAFRHLLVRDAAYQLLLRKDRIALHARVARTLISQFPTVAEALPHVVAIQLTDAGDFEQAASYWDRAGAIAARRSAYSEAVNHFAKAIEVNARSAESRARDERELAFHLNHLGALIAARGFTAEGVAQEMERAVRLSEKLGAKANLIPALASKWSVLGSSGSFRASYELALQISDIAADGTEVDRLLAHRVLGTTYLFAGELPRALDEFERFLALFDAARHGADLGKIGPSNHAIRVMLGLAQVYTLRGEWEASDHWRERVLAAAKESGQLHDICHVMVFAACFMAALRGQTDQLARYADELKSLTTAHDLPYWRGHADLFCGLALIRTGREEEGFVEARRGIKGLIASNAFAYGWYILYAEACVEAGRLAEADDVLALALPPLEQGEAWLAAEFHRVSARLALARGEGIEAARPRLQSALDIAETQGAALFAARIKKELAALARTYGADPEP